MKKAILAVCICLLASAAFAQKNGEVLLRYSRQENAVRIVLEAADDLIKNANTITSLSSVRIDFPTAVTITKQKDFLFDTSQKDRFFLINLKDVSDVKTYKLASPARIVIDLRLAPAQQKDIPAKPEAARPPAAAAAAPAAQGQKAPVAAETQKASAGQQSAQPQTPLQQPEKARRIRTVVVDPGHGGYDKGIISPDISEKEISLAIARDLSAALIKKGVSVYLLRKTDQPVSLSERISLASSRKPDLFISLHVSLSDSFVIYTASEEDINSDSAVRPYSAASRQTRHLEKSRSFAKALGTSIGTTLKGTAVLRELPLPLLYSMDAPAVLIESPLPGRLTYDQKMRELIVRALLAGVAAYEQ